MSDDTSTTETNDVPQIDVKAARAWLIEAGFQVGQRGRLNAEHRAAYLAHLARS